MRHHMINIFLLVQLTALYGYVAWTVAPHKATAVPVVLAIVCGFAVFVNIAELWQKAGERFE